MGYLDRALDAGKEIAAGPHAWIQWKGTEACLDIHCTCGELTHFDGYFAYTIRCGACGKIWALSSHVRMLELTDEEKMAEADHVPHGDSHV